MELNQTIKPALRQFADHFEAIVLKNGPLKEDFKDRIDHRRLSAQHLSLLETFASVTLAQDLKRGDINWWHTFTDYIKKEISVMKFDMPELQQLALGEMIIFSRWTTQSFLNILNIDDLLPDSPPFPARAEDVATVPLLLAYLEKTLVPVMEEQLELMLQWPHNRVEQFLSEKADLYILDGVPGIETFWAAPPEIRREELSVPHL